GMGGGAGQSGRETPMAPRGRHWIQKFWIVEDQSIGSRSAAAAGVEAALAFPVFALLRLLGVALEVGSVLLEGLVGAAELVDAAFVCDAGDDHRLAAVAPGVVAHEGDAIAAVEGDLLA